MNIIEIELPYMPELGKNQMKGFRKGGGYYVQQGYKDAVQAIVSLLVMKGKGIKWKQDKVWVEIFLQKSRPNSDVANFIDGIYDAIKIGIGVDDCWFAGKQDFEYDKEIEPYIIITITQE